MADALQDALTALNTTLRAMTGIVKWYDDPPESLNEFPCGLSYAEAGEMTAQGDWCKALHTVRVNIYQNRQVLPTAINAAKVWPYRLMNALRADQTLGGKVAAIVWPLSYRSQPLQFGEVVHYGVTFAVVLKIHAG
jgi:hypothetical protein